MKGYTIQHSIELLEKQAGSGSGGGSAADITYDHTSSGLTADDVQEAIDELNTDLGTLSATVANGIIYDSTERAIGKIGNDILYSKYLDIGTLPATTTKAIPHGISDLGLLFVKAITAKNPTTGLQIFMPYPTSTGSDQAQVYADATNLTVKTAFDGSGFTSCIALLEYTKVAPEQASEAKKTRKTSK